MGWVLAPFKLSHGDVFVAEVVSVGLEVGLGRSGGLVSNDNTLGTCVVKDANGLFIVSRDSMHTYTHT